MGLDLKVVDELGEQDGGSDLPGFSGDSQPQELKGGKRRRGRRTAKKSRKGKKVRKGKTAKKSRKGKRGASPWIAHVKAFCKKTGKTFPEALKDENEPGGFLHSGTFLLIDTNRHIRGIYDGTNDLEINRLIQDVNILFNSISE